MTELQRKYLARHEAWMRARETADLTQEQESTWVEQQELLWWQMSAAEQNELEVLIAPDPIEVVLEQMSKGKPPPAAPESLGLMDVVAATGVMPRKPSGTGPL